MTGLEAGKVRASEVGRWACRMRSKTAGVVERPWQEEQESKRRISYMQEVLRQDTGGSRVLYSWQVVELLRWVGPAVGSPA